MESLNTQEKENLNSTLLQHASPVHIQTTIFISHIMPTEAMQVLKQAQPLVEKMSTAVTLQHFESLYYIFAHHHRKLGNIVEEMDCHIKILIKSRNVASMFTVVMQ